MLLLCLGVPTGHPYNVDTESALLYQGPPNTLFGYSVSRSGALLAAQWPRWRSARENNLSWGVSAPGVFWRKVLELREEEVGKLPSCRLHSYCDGELNGQQSSRLSARS
ncbi:hypothetical protein P7K49_013905 [Saguinus oedipus]|uniref:Uncharacterized protein n=1 Tax=Saguinus oedipus TaxID=9490 RepID=A0ABQ9VHA6_SAGOE|nr:hypothetical protein P7K49_013905 [Saguinus oedipus]